MVNLQTFSLVTLFTDSIDLGKPCIIINKSKKILLV